MPYKNKEDRLENNRLKHRVERDNFYEALGLRVVPGGWLICDFCGKQTRRGSAQVFSHHPTCVWRPVAMKLLGQPKDYWNRRHMCKLCGHRTPHFNGMCGSAGCYCRGVYVHPDIKMNSTVEDIRDNRDPAEVGKEVLREHEVGHHDTNSRPHHYAGKDIA
jgi:hypothetical protein